MKQERIDEQINRFRAKLATLYKKRRPKKKQRPAAARGRGRPAVDAKMFEVARTLVAEGNSIGAVADALGIGKTTLFDHGITREKVERTMTARV